MLQPLNIKKGDQVAIIATARKINNKEVAEAIRVLKQWELVPVLGNTVGLENDQFAGSDDARRLDFQNMLDDPAIKAIWCARGGYGTVRIIDQIDFTNFVKHPKWIIGYSDITVIHSHVHNLGVATLHAVMPIDVFKATDQAVQSLKDILFGNIVAYKISVNLMNKSGVAKGALIGGNLSILYSLCGSASSLDTRGKILCIEDLDEYLYHIDRMLQNLKRNGFFDGIAGLIVGAMTQMHDNNIPFGKNVEEIILDSVAGYDFPVVFDFPMGHITDNRALIMGADVSLKVDKHSATVAYL